MAERIIAIGDIHGCVRALDALIEKMEIDESDTLVFLGDYIDRGPDSSKVIDRLIELERDCQLISLIGNHEVMMLTALEQPSEIHFWLQCGGQSTVDSYGGDLSAIPFPHVNFLRDCRLYYETEDYLFVHANYIPDMPMERQPHHTLLWEHLTKNSMPGPHASGKIAIVGHTPQVNGEILNLDHILCIDTHCYGRGWLTALDVTTGQYWQADREGLLRIE